MALKKNSNENNLEGSPLIKNDEMQESPLHSTIHPERFDMSRFSERRDDEESSFRIILYVVVVIIIGVGLALFVRFLISNQSEDSDDQNTNPGTQEETVTPNSAVQINSTAKPDPSNAPRDNEYSVQSLISVGAASATTNNVSVASLAFDSFVTFSRVTLGVDGVSPTASLPQFSIDFNSETKQMKISIPEGVEIDEDIKTNILVNGTIVNDITFNPAENALVVNLTRDARYVVDPSTSSISIYFKSDALFVEGADTTEETTDEKEDADSEQDTTKEDNTDDKDTTSDPGRPQGVNYENDFSQKTQYVTSSVKTDSITYNETFYEDAGSYFELAWGSRNNVGDKFVPNAKAELVQEGGKYFIEVTVENLADLTVAKTINSSVVSFSLEAANFVESKLISFDDGVATFRVELKRASNFRLVSEPTISGQTQVLSLQIQD